MLSIWSYNKFDQGYGDEVINDLKNHQPAKVYVNTATKPGYIDHKWLNIKSLDGLDAGYITVVSPDGQDRDVQLDEIYGIES